jgi:hypothetical protein
VACYLCTYQQTHVPQTVRPLPAGTPVTTDELGTCNRCQVAACAAHGSRYGHFECAMCRSATATQQSVVASAGVSQAGGSGASAAIARSVGRHAESEFDRVERALQRIAHDQERGATQLATLEFAGRYGEPNLVTNLAEAIRVVRGEDVPFIPVRDLQTVSDLYEAENAGAISVEAIAGAVRDAFALEPIVITDDAVVVVTGALVLAMSVADNPGGNVVVEPDEVPIRAPWQVTHPVLLDPVMWMVATAYQSQ